MAAGGVKAGLGGVPGKEGVRVWCEAGDLGETEGLGVAWVVAGASLPGSGDNLSDLTSLEESEGILSSTRVPLNTSRRTFLRPLVP